jgi:methylmalonyl-CoA mutase N-terminal domain/subunit
MLAAARSGENMIPPMLAAARAEATLGEICDVLRQEWGVYSEAPAF